MAIDPTRATFVQREYGYEKAEDLTVRSNFPSANEYVLDTNLSAASAATVATNIFNETKAPALVYQVEIEGTFQLEDFAGGVPRYVLNDASYGTDGRTFKVTSVQVDYLNNVSTLVVRG